MRSRQPKLIWSIAALAMAASTPLSANDAGPHPTAQMAGLERVMAKKEALLPAIAYNAALIGDRKRTRLIVDFEGKIERDVYTLANPPRVVVGLPKTLFSLNEDYLRTKRSLVAQLDGKTGDGADSKIVLELSAPASIEQVQIKALEVDGRNRLIVDLAATDAETFDAKARKPAPPPEPEPEIAAERIVKVDPATEAPRRFTIVLDPGHGGADGGAKSRSRVVEKVFTLDFAERLGKKLREIGPFDVVLTRTKDTFLSLRQRVAIARKAQGDLFISIHADSLRQRYIRGATVYTLSRKGSDSLSRALARKQNRADLVSGLEIEDIDGDVSDILIDMTRRETTHFSKDIAGLLVEELRNSTRLIRNPHRSAAFKVLKAPEIPSVLLEMGYLSNRSDAKLLANVGWQEKVATRIASAIHRFFQPRMSRTVSAAAN